MVRLAKKFVDVAFVAVAFVTMNPPLNVRSVVVAFNGNGSWSAVPVASVPQLKTPAGDAFTSHAAAFKLETMSCVVDAVPVIARFVVVAFVVVELPVMTRLPLIVEEAVERNPADCQMEEDALAHFT